jgi:hypothetical protein
MAPKHERSRSPFIRRIVCSSGFLCGDWRAKMTADDREPLHDSWRIRVNAIAAGYFFASELVYDRTDMSGLHVARSLVPGSFAVCMQDPRRSD